MAESVMFVDAFDVVVPTCTPVPNVALSRFTS